MEEENSFKSTSGFCPDCGSILPLLQMKGGITCYNCTTRHPPNVFSDMKVNYTIAVNAAEAFERNLEDEKRHKRDKKSAEEGPIVDRKCPKCGNDKMSYATLQLRSADEGQTVFYTCTKCNHKETENS